MELPVRLIWGLQQVQNVVARLVIGVSQFYNISPVFDCLNWLPMMSWIKFKVLVITYKALHSLGPHYFLEHLYSITSTCVTKYSQAMMLLV